MLLRRKAVESLLNRQSHRIARESNVRNRKRIDKRKYYGIKKNINEYSNLIYSTMYQPEELKKLLSEDGIGTEGLSDVFTKYLEKISFDMHKLLDEFTGLFEDTFIKGGKRVLDKNGEPVKHEVNIAEVKDNRALQVIQANQQTYFKNILESQQKTIFKQIEVGINEGLSTAKTAELIQTKVEGITKARANTIARTEMVKAHNLGNLETMKEVGAKTYIYWTSGDKKVAPICQKLQGSRSKPHIYQVAQAGDNNNPLPVIHSHPNCRCVVLIND